MKSVKKNSKNDSIEKKCKMKFFVFLKKLFGIFTVINFKNYWLFAHHRFQINIHEVDFTWLRWLNKLKDNPDDY